MKKVLIWIGVIFVIALLATAIVLLNINKITTALNIDLSEKNNEETELLFDKHKQILSSRNYTYYCLVPQIYRLNGELGTPDQHYLFVRNENELTIYSLDTENNLFRWAVFLIPSEYYSYIVDNDEITEYQLLRKFSIQSAFQQYEGEKCIDITDDVDFDACEISGWSVLYLDVLAGVVKYSTEPIAYDHTTSGFALGMGEPYVKDGMDVEFYKAGNRTFDIYFYDEDIFYNDSVGGVVKYLGDSNYIDNEQTAFEYLKAQQEIREGYRK